VHDGVVVGLLGQVQLVEGRQPGQRRVGLTGIGEVYSKVGDRWVLQCDEVGVGDVVALLGKVRRDMATGCTTRCTTRISSCSRARAT